MIMLTPKLHHLLLKTPQPQPPPPMMMHHMGYKMIVVVVETRPVHLRRSHQKGCLQEACSEEFKNNNDFALLHHKFFCKGEWGWGCRVISILISFMLPAIFVFLYLFYYLVDPL
jgi:hypothetical protein